MKVKRAMGVAASSEDVWRVVGDPYHFPRWWPRVERVENVTESEFTAVLRSDRGRVVRADYRLLAPGPPVRSWELVIEGTPFERVLRSQVTTVRVEDQAVSIEIEQKPRRFARLGGIMMRTATKKIVDEALTGLKALVA